MDTLFFFSFIGAIFYLGYIWGGIHPDLLTVDATEIARAQEICVNANSKISKMSSLTVTCENGGEFKYVDTKKD